MCGCRVSISEGRVTRGGAITALALAAAAVLIACGPPCAERPGDVCLVIGTGDFGFNPALSRNISVDVRYLLWNLERVERAEELLQELGLAR